MKMSISEMETIQRMIGTIEGAVYGIGKREGIVYDALGNINAILDKAEVVIGGEQK